MYRVVGKRAIDLVLASLGLTVLLPVLAVVSLMVWWGDGWPVLFSHPRTGRGGRVFPLLKFRSMVRDASSRGPSHTDAGDPRITPTGAWIRRTSLDELPQLWNVLRGDMSLVGPRPDTPGQTAALPPDVASRRWSVRPGITGLAQVSGRSAVTPDRRLELDLTYVETVSLAGDLRIVFLTVLQTVMRRDAAW